MSIVSSKESKKNGCSFVNIFFKIKCKEDFYTDFDEALTLVGAWRKRNNSLAKGISFSILIEDFETRAELEAVIKKVIVKNPVFDAISRSLSFSFAVFGGSEVQPALYIRNSDGTLGQISIDA